MNESGRHVGAAIKLDNNGEGFAPLFQAWLRHWRAIVICAVIGALLGFGLALVLRPSYTARMSLVPASNGLEVAPDGALGGIATAMAGLGMQLPRSQSASDYILFPQVISTSDIAAKVLARKDLMRHIFYNEYDPGSGQFRPPPGLRNSAKMIFFGMFGQPSYIPPSIPRVRQYIRRYVKVTSATTTTPVTTLEYSDRDPMFAREFLIFLYRSVDGQLRTWRVNRAQENSVYLERKLSTVAAVDYRAGLLNQLIPQQMTVMMSNPRSAFSARIIDGPSTGDRPDFPRPFLLIGVGFILGMFIAAGFIALEVFLPKAPNPLRIARSAVANFWRAILSRAF